MKHNRLATVLVVTGSVLGLAACSWFGGDADKQASSQSTPMRSTASNSGASGAGGSYSSGPTASNPSASSMSANVGSSPGKSGSSRVSSSEMRDVQQHLQQLGYYKGKIDGIWGKQSRQAMAQFQRSQGISASGQIDDQSLQALNSGSTGSSTATGSSGMSSSSRPGASNQYSGSRSMSTAPNSSSAQAIRNQSSSGTDNSR